MTSALAPALAFAVCTFVLWALLRRGGRLPMDHPNGRSLHAAPTPRIGGIGIMSGVFLASLWLADAALLPIMIAAFALAAISLLDDLHNLPVGMRFIAHFVAAAACLFALGLTGWGLVGATLGVVWMTNLYNFMDGADGLAGGMGAIGFGAFAVAAGLSGDAKLAAFCAVISAASLAFLRFNFPPARLFMGDAGSIPLGFLAAVVGILGTRSGIWPWIFPLLVFSPFIVDASVTLIRRALKGEKVWRAHRSHYYQRAVLLGASHRQLAYAAFGLMLLMTGLAFMARARPQYAVPVLILSAVLYLMIFSFVDRRWRLACNEH